MLWILGTVTVTSNETVLRRELVKYDYTTRVLDLLLFKFYVLVLDLLSF